ncbi:MAG: hypothetical protein QGI45_09130 [Myxococcota bacterium]|nr:hypothetical protein [Myxococcota bacterium]
MRSLNKTTSVKIGFALLALTTLYYRCYSTWAHFNSKFASLDGGYYLDVTQNILAGLGIYTDISPFHQGLPFLPYPSTIYPVWPLCMAFFGLIFPAWTVAFILPMFLYFLVLYAAYVAGRHIHPGKLCTLGTVSIHGGHLLMLCFALQRGFFIATSRPYTEGLTYALVLATIVVIKRYFAKPTFPAGILLGALSCIIFLTRTQLLVFTIALVGTTLLATLSNRRKHGLGFVGIFLGFSLCFSPQWYWLSTFVSTDIFWQFFRFDAYQATPYLPIMAEDFPTDGTLGFILDRLYGFLVAFLPLNKFGYHRVFFTLQFFVPLFLAFGLPRIVTTHFTSLRQLGVRDFIASLNFFTVFIWAFAIGGLLSLHVIHLDNPTHEWFFGTRHALIAVFLFFLSCCQYLSLGLWHKRVGALLLLIFVGYGFSEMNTVSRRAHKQVDNLPGQPYPLIDWINAHTDANNYRIFAMPSNWGKRLAIFTPHAGYRDIRRHDNLNVLKTMTTQLRTDYVVIYQKWEQLDELAPFFESKAIPGLKLVHQLEDFDIYRVDKPFN